jgi:4-hydroxyphenylpyruvate dioxygenase
MSTVESERPAYNRKLVGYKSFQRHNPLSDLFEVRRFHHVEFWCGDATNTSRRFSYGLGMPLIARSDQGTGNHKFASYVLRSGELTFAFTAPYSVAAPKEDDTHSPLPAYDEEHAYEFLKRHGLAVRALGIEVADADVAYHAATAKGAVSVLPPTRLTSKGKENGSLTVAEIKLYGDVVLRFVSGDFSGPFVPGYETVANAPQVSYGLQRLDHAVGNVPELMPAIEYLAGCTGFHEFAEFVAEDVGTVDSGLNSMVLASNNEMVLLPINEPTHGTRRKSQIQTYLEQNEGAGLQHMALKTDDIFHTLREMRARSDFGGFDFMPRPSEDYYKSLPEKIGDTLTPDQYQECEKLGILVDRDDQGVLLQIFTKPLGDRPTVFIEIIQRLCMVENGHEGNGQALEQDAVQPVQPTPVEVGGCGG